MLAWMLYVIMVTLLLSLGAFVAERAARLKRGGTRWIWLTAIVASLLIPTVIASVSVQLPSVITPRVAQKMVVLREATTQALSPVTWISGSAAEPRGWRDYDDLLINLWQAASAAMLLALVVSGVHVFMRKRRWRHDTVCGVSVYVTEDIGPAVVGLLRPRIVVPRWVTLALPTHQTSVIAHEQSHLDAHDPQMFTLALGLLVFMPWNLPLWWQLRRLRYAIEVDCDARVLRGGVDPANYGETLIAVGERQSAYVGAVAAMSESRSFLEERIRIMISKPIKWRRLATVAFACSALALTALAAQVSPPNNSGSTATAQAGSSAEATHKAEPKIVSVPAAILDRYAGVYRFKDMQLYTVRRKGEGLEAQLTGQGFYDLNAESESRFFYKIIPAQIEFQAQPGAPASQVTLYQGGGVFVMPRLDSGTAEQARVDLAARLASNTPMPGSESALRRFADSLAAGTPAYELMTADIAEVTRKQISAGGLDAMKMLGTVQSISFQRVGDGGWDTFRVKYENGSLMWRVSVNEEGKISFAAVLPDA